MTSLCPSGRLHDSTLDNSSPTIPFHEVSFHRSSIHHTCIPCLQEFSNGFWVWVNGSSSVSTKAWTIASPSVLNSITVLNSSTVAPTPTNESSISNHNIWGEVPNSGMEEATMKGQARKALNDGLSGISTKVSGMRKEGPGTGTGSRFSSGTSSPEDSSTIGELKTSSKSSVGTPLELRLWAATVKHTIPLSLVKSSFSLSSSLLISCLLWWYVLVCFGAVRMYWCFYL